MELGFITFYMFLVPYKPSTVSSPYLYLCRTLYFGAHDDGSQYSSTSYERHPQNLKSLYVVLTSRISLLVYPSDPLRNILVSEAGLLNATRRPSTVIGLFSMLKTSSQSFPLVVDRRCSSFTWKL